MMGLRTSCDPPKKYMTRSKNSVIKRENKWNQYYHKEWNLKQNDSYANILYIVKVIFFYFVGDLYIPMTQSFKDGQLYDQLKMEFQPLDVIFFRGDGIFSKVIRLYEQHGHKIPNMSEFSHVGMVVTSEILEHPKIVPGQLYILESIVASHRIPTIEGTLRSGTQLRNLDQVVTSFDQSPKTKIAWARLIKRPNPHNLKTRFTQIFDKYNKTSYDINPYSLQSSVFPFMRPLRKHVTKICNSHDWYFCSELIANIYKDLGVYPTTVNPEDVLPRDIAYPCADLDSMPVIVGKITHLTTLLHYRPKGHQYQIRI